MSKKCRYCEAGYPLVDAGFVGHQIAKEDFDKFFPDGLEFEGQEIPKKHVIVLCEDFVEGAESLSDMLRKSTWRKLETEEHHDF